MGLRRQRIDRSVSITVNTRVVDLPSGWAFTIRCQACGQDYAFDFASLREGRDDLARHMRDALWSMRYEVVGQTLHNYFMSLRSSFWRFLDALDGAGQSVTRLDQIDRRLIRDYLAWMERQIATTGPSKGEPLGVGARRVRYQCLKTLLINRQQRTPEAINPDLAFPRNPFPSVDQHTSHRAEYSDAEQARILAACNADLRRLHEGAWDEADHQVYALHAVIFGFALGANATPLLEVRRDSLKPHPLKDREILALTKRRGYSTSVTALRRSALAQLEDTLAVIPRTVGDHFRWLCEFTAPLQAEARPEDRALVFLYRLVAKGSTCRGGQVVRLSMNHLISMLAAFARRHDLRDDSGAGLKLSLARLRPTFATNLYRRTRDVRKVQKALGHADANTTARRYLPSVTLEAERNHAFVGQAMVGWVTHCDETRAAKLAADGHLPLQDARELLRGGYNTAVARCRNPFRAQDRVCGKYLACFQCPSMMVFEDDLYRLFSFRNRLLGERPKIAPHHWVQTYGWVVKVIEEAIAPQFAAEVVEEAKRAALEHPHPAWAMDRLP